MTFLHSHSLQNPVAGVFGAVFGRKKSGHHELLKRLFELGHSDEQVVNEILAFLVGVTVEVSLGRCKSSVWTASLLTFECVALTNVVNLLLDSEKNATFRGQAKSVDTKDLAGLEAYVIEALSAYEKLAWNSLQLLYVQVLTLLFRERPMLLRKTTPLVLS